MKKYILGFTLVLSMGRLRVFAQHADPIETDRPGESESPSIVLKRHLQVESGFSYEKTDHSSKEYLHPSTLWRYGVSNKFELRLLTELTTKKDSLSKISGLNPISVGFKINLLEEKGMIPTTSFIGYLKIPDLASKNLKATHYAPAFRFTMQHTLSKKFTLGYNLGAEWDEETAEPTVAYTVTTGYEISDKWKSFIELYGFATKQERADHRVDAGISYQVQSNMQIDFSGGVGITDNSPDYFTALGFSFRFKD